jgi:hypothetical protein
MVAWWNLGLPRLVFSPELAPVPAGSSSAARTAATSSTTTAAASPGTSSSPTTLQYDIAGTLGNGTWGYIVGSYDKDAGPDNQRLYLNGIRVAQMSDTLPIDLNSAALGIGRHVSGIADPFNGHVDEFRIAHVQRSDGWIETIWNNMSDPGAFAAAGAEEQEWRRAATAGRRRGGRLPDGVSVFGAERGSGPRSSMARINMVGS